jgi:hypothetical protein
MAENLMKQCLILLLREHLQRADAASPLFMLLQDQRLARAIARRSSKTLPRPIRSRASPRRR